MTTPFIFPSITSLPPGYDCTVSIPTARLGAKVICDGTIRCLYRVFHDGSVVHAEEHRVAARQGTIAELPIFHWKDHSVEWNSGGGFLEISFRSDNGLPIFDNTRLIGFYSIYSKPGKKSFFSDNAFRYGAPPTINQIAAFGRFVDAYPVVHIDRRHDLGETLTLINPYEKPVLVSIMTHDGRIIRKRRVNPSSVLNIRLVEFLKDNEDQWLGQIQLTATNRLVTFHVKHSLTDPSVISDHEHLDPFRGDETHYPATQMIRLRAGLFLKNRRQIP